MFNQQSSSEHLPDTERHLLLPHLEWATLAKIGLTSRSNRARFLPSDSTMWRDASVLKVVGELEGDEREDVALYETAVDKVLFRWPPASRLPAVTTAHRSVWLQWLVFTQWLAQVIFAVKLWSRVANDPILVTELVAVGISLLVYRIGSISDFGAVALCCVAAMLHLVDVLRDWHTIDKVAAFIKEHETARLYALKRQIQAHEDMILTFQRANLPRHPTATQARYSFWALSRQLYVALWNLRFCGVPSRVRAALDANADLKLAYHDADWLAKLLLAQISCYFGNVFLTAIFFITLFVLDTFSGVTRHASAMGIGLEFVFAVNSLLIIADGVQQLFVPWWTTTYKQALGCTSGYNFAYENLHLLPGSKNGAHYIRALSGGYETSTITRCLSRIVFWKVPAIAVIGALCLRALYAFVLLVPGPADDLKPLKIGALLVSVVYHRNLFGIAWTMVSYVYTVLVRVHYPVWRASWKCAAEQAAERRVLKCEPRVALRHCAV